MVSVNYSSREVNCKIVYYGPGLSGKTTNLQYVHAKVPKKTRGDLISLATDADRTLYFDFLPINIGTINGFATKFQLYTVPGQVFYNATRKLVLRGVDGLVFVADSQRSKRDENIESLNNLKENLVEYGYDINTLPIVLQYNKRDLPEVMAIGELETDLNWNNLPFFEASAVKGLGVFDTLKLITKMVLNRAKRTDQHVAAAPGNAISAAEPVAPFQPVAAPLQTYPQVAASSTSTAVAQAPAFSADAPPRRVEVREVSTESEWETASAAPQEAPATPRPTRHTMADIESKLQQIDNNDFEGMKRREVEKLRPADAETSPSQFADTFDVPKVIGMQRSLKAKKKKRRFFLFRWFGGDND
jgi:hypothetical protein